MLLPKFCCLIRMVLFISAAFSVKVLVTEFIFFLVVDDKIYQLSIEDKINHRVPFALCSPEKNNHFIKRNQILKRKIRDACSIVDIFIHFIPFIHFHPLPSFLIKSFYPLSSIYNILKQPIDT